MSGITVRCKGKAKGRWLSEWLPNKCIHGAAADIVLLAPGLSVVIDVIQEARKIFQRMNSYTIYRIAETIRVLLFMTLSILVFNFYPVTAVMIVLLALLNDGAILSIAYDREHYGSQPERWNMRLVLGIASVLGLAGLVPCFLLFYLAEQVDGLNRDTIQSLIYLKLSVAGHMTVLVTRMRGPFWSIRPANILLAAVIGTQIVATLLAIDGIFLKPIGWQLAGLVWLYAFAGLLVNDRLKLMAEHHIAWDASREARRNGISRHPMSGSTFKNLVPSANSTI